MTDSSDSAMEQPLGQTTAAFVVSLSLLWYWVWLVGGAPGIDDITWWLLGVLG